jgi:hypothetical protein
MEHHEWTLQDQVAKLILSTREHVRTSRALNRESYQRLKVSYQAMKKSLEMI